MPQSIAETIKSETDTSAKAPVMEREESSNSDHKFSMSTRTNSGHRQTRSNSLLQYLPPCNQHRNYQKNGIHRGTPKQNKFNQQERQRKQRTIFELEGNQKYTFKGGLYFENLRCPSCIMNNLAQTYKYRGIPWCDYRVNYRTDFADHYEGLSAELEVFYRFIRPNNEDEVLRKATFYCISKSIKRCTRFEIEAVKYYGSYSSNTYLPVSDIDLVVYCDSRENVVGVLFELAYLLFQDGIIEKHCSILPHSRIPLLKFYDCLTGFPINITVNTPNVMERADYVREHMGRQSNHMTKIMYFLKFYLLYKGSNQVFHGGIGSYALSLMVIRFFQESTTQDLIKTYEKSRTLLARLLIGFLQRYSDIDFIRNHIISVRDGGAYIAAPPIADDHHYSGNPLFKKTSILRIEDHLEPWKNVSSGSFNSDLILNDFGHLLNTLLNPNPNSSDNRVSIIGTGLAVVDSFVDFRAILSHVYGEWFSHALVYSKGHAYDKYDTFIMNRNIFGRRHIVFEYKRFDDNTAELILKDKFDPAFRYMSNKHFGRYYGHEGWNGLHAYSFYQTFSRREHSPAVRQHYPSDSVSSETNESLDFNMNLRKASKPEQALSHQPPSRIEGKRACLIPIECNNSLAKQPYQVEQKPTFRRKDKFRTGHYFNFAEPNIDDSTTALEPMNLNSKIGGDSQMMMVMDTPKKQGPHHVEGGKANGGGGKQKNTPESGGKRKGRGQQAKKAMNQKLEQAEVISPQPPPTSSHQPSIIPITGMKSSVASYADRVIWTEMASNSKTAELKKILNMGPQS